MKYLVEKLGDISGKDAFPTLEKALEHIAEFTAQDQTPDDWNPNPTCHSTDPEDNRILIWEILDSGHMKVVWHFSGWHWDSEEFGLPQGKLLGHEKSLYEESND